MVRIQPDDADGMGSEWKDVETPSRVYVNGTRIPVGDVEIHIRNEGPLSITRYAEVYFYSPALGEDWLQYFDSNKPDEQTDWDTLRIEVKDRGTEAYHTEFHGLVTGLGNSSNSMEKEFLARAKGPGHIVNRIPASKTFRDPRVADVLDYVVSELDDHLPFDVHEGNEGSDEDVNSVTWNWIGSNNSEALSPKTFQSNRDYIGDVLSWLEDRTETRVWLEPVYDGVNLLSAENPSGRKHWAHYLDGDLYVVDNNALNELSPVNTAIVKGGAKKSLASVGDFELNVGSDTYNVAKARHTELYERSGGREYSVRDTITDATSSGEVKNEAKSFLKRQITQATGGSMETLLRSPIKPFDLVEAKPTCDQSAATDTDPVTYEVTRVHHKITGQGIPTTKLNIGVHATLDDIEVIDSWEKEA